MMLFMKCGIPKNPFSQAMSLAGSAKHPLFYRQRIITIGESEAFAKQAYCACRIPYAEASVLWMPPIPAEAAPTPPCPLMTNYLVPSLSFFVRRLSSVAIIFVPLRFVIIFYSKIFSLKPLMEHLVPLIGEQ
jgi:hypothetical protein